MLRKDQKVLGTFINDENDSYPNNDFLSEASSPPFSQITTMISVMWTNHNRGISEPLKQSTSFLDVKAILLEKYPQLSTVLLHGH